MKRTLNISPALRIHTLNNCFLTRFRAPYYFPGEFHPFWEMVYVTEGSLYAASEEKVYIMQKGDVIFHKPMEFHRLWSTEDCDIHAFIVGFSAKGDGLKTLEDGAFVLKEEQQEEMDRMIDFLKLHFSEKKHFLDDMKENYFEMSGEIQIFVNQFENFLLSLTHKRSPLTEKELAIDEGSVLYRMTVEELSRNVEGWITTEELAERLCCSTSQLKRTFAKFSNIGIHKYLLKLKTAAAGRMLRHGLSSSEIAARLGFSNQNYFSTVFKRETGVSPSRYLRHDPEEK